MIPDICRELFCRLLKVMLDSIDDPDVRLMQQLVVDLRRLHSGFL